MKVAIVGSREYHDLAAVWRYVESLPEDTVIVSGGARGVDAAAEMAAKSLGMETEIFKPEYDKYAPRIAPLMRNRQIVLACDELVAFWDGTSRGTRNTIELARGCAKPVQIFR